MMSNTCMSIRLSSLSEWEFCFCVKQQNSWHICGFFPYLTLRVMQCVCCTRHIAMMMLKRVVHIVHPWTVNELINWSFQRISNSCSPKQNYAQVQGFYKVAMEKKAFLNDWCRDWESARLLCSITCQANGYTLCLSVFRFVFALAISCPTCNTWRIQMDTIG